MHRIIKQSTCTQSPMKILKYLGIQQNPTWGIILCKSFEQPIYFLAQLQKWNAYKQSLYWYNNKCCSKFMQEMRIQLSKVLSYTALNSTLYYLNATFLHKHFDTKSAYLGPSIFLYISDIV